MKETFRQSMSLLHTWAGVLLGGVLFAIFWTGSLTLFDREIDRWMRPATRLAPAPTTMSFDERIKPTVERMTAGAHGYDISFPNDRFQAFAVGYEDPKTKEYRSQYINPHTGEILPDEGTDAGSGFIYPFHFSLHLNWRDMGEWLVGVASMAMFLLLVTGVIIHRRIFADFFTFRPKKVLARSSLDLHNLTGVLMLPFHLTLTLSGLILFVGLYFPYSISVPFGGDPEALDKELYGGFSREAANQPGRQPFSLDKLMKRAEAEWGGGKAGYISVHHPGDANSYVWMYRHTPDSITENIDQIVFDAGSGEILHRNTPKSGVASFRGIIFALHFAQFNHWTLRWLYFFAGLSSCALIATGFLYWLEARRKRHAREPFFGFRVVEGLTVASVTGIVIATLTFFVVNRILPLTLANRADWEIRAFFLAWLAAFIHAYLRPSRETKRAFIEQAWAIGALASIAVALNWATTGDHLIRTIAQDGRGAIAGMDAVLIAAAVVAVGSARRMSQAGRQIAPASMVEKSEAIQEPSNA